MFELDRYLRERRQLIETALDAEMPRENTPPATLHRAMRYSVFSGGKRLRPILCLAACEALAGTIEAALLPSLAIEVLHAYTLIHDDLPCMDNDDWRHGKKTAHRVFGEANAVLAGDALLTLAFEFLGRVSAPPPYPPTKLVLELATAAGSRGVVGGQAEDLRAVGKTLDVARLGFIHEHKTAALFKAAVRIGAILGGSAPEQLAALSDYGINLGRAFQIVDDLLDAGPRDQQSAGDGKGKKHGVKELSCLSVYTPAQARQQAEQFLGAALTALTRLPATARTEPLAAIARYVLERDH